MTMHVYPIRALENTARDTRGVMSLPLFGSTSARPLGARSGVRYGTPTTTVELSGFSGTVKPHAGVLDVQTSAEAGGYWYSVTVAEAFTVNAAHATLARVDLVSVQVDDPDEDGTGSPTVRIVYTAGTAAVSPVAPTAPARSVSLATIAVPASGGGNPTVSWIAPYAVGGGGIIPVRTTTERDALHSAYPGTTDAPLVIWLKSAGAFYYNDGTGWEALGADLTALEDMIPRAVADHTAVTHMDGRIVLNTTTDVWYGSNNSAWVALHDPAAVTDWAALTLQNSWVSFGGAFATPSYRLINNVVYVKGGVKSGTTTAGTVIATLPSGFRPAESRKIVTMITGSALGSLDVTSAGAITINVANATYTSLDFSFAI